MYCPQENHYSQIYGVLSPVFRLAVQKVKRLPVVPFVVLSAIGDLIYQQALSSNIKSYKKFKNLEGFFSITRSLSLAWTIGRLFQEIFKKKIFLPASELERANFSLARRVLLLSFGAVCLFFSRFITAVAIKKIDELVGALQGRVEANELIGKEAIQSNGITVSWKKPRFIEFNRGLLFLQIVTSIALVFFSKINFFLLAAVNGYSLYKMSNRQFLSIVKKTTDIYKILAVTVTYRSIVMAKENKEKENCDTCFTPDEQKKIYSICEKHAYCGTCVTNLFADKLNDLNRNLINSLKFHKMLNLNRKIVKKTQFEVCLNLENLHSCPKCPGTLLDQNELEIVIQEPSDNFPVPVPISYLHYQIGKTISLKLERIEKVRGGKYLAISSLRCATRVVFFQIDKRKAAELIKDQKTIKATIQKAIISNGYLYLICTSEVLPELKLKEYQIGEQVEVQNISSKKHEGCLSFFGKIADGRKACFLNLSETIPLNNLPELAQGIITHTDDDYIYCSSDQFPKKESYFNKDLKFEIIGLDQDKQLYFGHLDSGEKIYYVPCQADKCLMHKFTAVQGIVFREEVTPDKYELYCSPYQVNSKIQLSKFDAKQDLSFKKEFEEEEGRNDLICRLETENGDNVEVYLNKEDWKKVVSQDSSIILKKILVDEAGDLSLIHVLEDSLLDTPQFCPAEKVLKGSF